MTQDRCTRKFIWAVGIGNDEAVLRVGIRAGALRMMAAERSNDFPESDGALGLRLAFPVHCESLTADTATEFRGN